jgi:hypothetical protein
MNSFELPQTDSSHSVEDEPEPLPITAELVGELIHYIKDLWTQYDRHKGQGNDIRTKLQDELHLAYDELRALKDELASLQFADNLHNDVQFELWFACYHLHKVLKY